MNLAKRWEVLDLQSESILIWEEDGYWQTGCVCLVMEGRCEYDALDRALFDAMDAEPKFHGRLKPAVLRGRHVMVWDFADHRPRLEVYDHTDEPMPEDINGCFHQLMEPLIAGKIDLTRELPIRFQMHRLPGDVHLFMYVFHHVVADAARIFEFLREAFIGYHQAVKGAPPEWRDTSAIHAVAGKKQLAMPSKLSYYRELIGNLRKYPLNKATVLDGDGADHPGRIAVHREITDEKLMTALRKRAKAAGGGLSDLIIAAGNLAIDEWNDARGVASDIFLSGLAVNQRGRRADEEIADICNPMGLLPIVNKRSERTSSEAVLADIVSKRVDGLSRGLDVLLMRDVHRIMRVAQFMPFERRQKLLHPLLALPTSFFLSNAGIIWPEIKNGRFTGDSAIREVGDLEITDIHLSLGGVRTTPMGTVTQTFRKKFYFEYVADLSQMSRANVEEFHELIMRKLTDFL